MRARILTTILGILLVGDAITQNDIGRFKNFTIRDGLSQSSVIDIFQDRKGYIWFGTSDGLNKFDGINFTVYKNNYKDVNSLSDNSIIKILLEDSQNNLWILTGDRAINKLSLQTEQFQRIIPRNNDPNSIPEYHSLHIFDEDLQKNIWISTDKGLFKIDNSTTKVAKYSFPQTGDSAGKNINPVRAFKDKKGNLWFYSQKGIFLYDYKNNTFVQFESKEGSLLSNKIFRIFEMDSSQLCIVNEKGINLYLSKENKFLSYPFPEKLSFLNYKKLSTPAIADNKGNIWIGTANGLLRFDLGLKTFKLYSHSMQPGSLSSNLITKITTDKSGNIWIGTINGLNQYIPSSDNFVNYYRNENKNPDDYISEIMILNNNEVWVWGKMQENGGSYLSCVNKKAKTLESYVYRTFKHISASGSLVFRPLIDKDGNLWFGSFSNGAMQYIPQSKKFRHYFNNPNDATSIIENDVWGFTEDFDGNIWIALYESMARFDTVTGSFTNYKPKFKYENKNVSYTLMNMVTDRKGNIWIASAGAGLIHLNPKSYSFKAYMCNPNAKNSISSNRIQQVFLDKSGKIWLAHHNNGVDVFDPETGVFRNMKHNPSDPNSLSNNMVRVIAEDLKNNIWIASDGYIDCYNPITKKFTHYKSKDNVHTGILADKALCIYADSKGNVWFGTSGGGLSKFNYNTGKFIHYTEIEGLSNNVVYGIVEDKQNNLWLSTNRGITKFDTKNLTFTKYYESSGLQSDEFNQGAYFKSSTNQIYFGGINGFNVFDPLSIGQDTVTYGTILCCIQFSGKQVPVIHPAKRLIINPNKPNRVLKDSSGYYLPLAASYLNKIEIPHHVKVFTLEFTSIMLTNSRSYSFRYKMEGFDTDWNHAVNRNYATYTNLPPGEYVFKVSAANSDGYWNPNAYELKITIIPPFWKTWWFITLIVITVLCFIRLFIYLRLKNLKRSKAILEHKIKERTRQIAEKNEELQLRNIEISKQKEEIMFQARQLKSELIMNNKVSEMALLRAQINPHFLFNTLNNLYSLVYKKSDDAPAAIMKLSEIMRYMLYDANIDKVPLEKEINYLKSFIELQLLRIKNKDFI
jgi:ligand-binding sensor domain-containing protein